MVTTHSQSQRNVGTVGKKKKNPVSLSQQLQCYFYISV